MNQTTKFGLKDLIYILAWIVVAVSMISQFDIKITPKSSLIALAATPAPEVVYIDKPDPRVQKLQSYLEDKRSPLAPFALLIISQADNYGLDWTRVVAISKIESDFGKRIPNGSFNAWGIGGHSLRHYASWEESIKDVSHLLGVSYKQSENEGIKYNYCPSSDGCNPAWAKTVTNTSKDILTLN